MLAPNNTASGMVIRSGAGLGDALYLQAIVRHLVRQGHRGIEVRTCYPDVFRPLNGAIRLAKFSREGVTKIAHYTAGKKRQDTDQFQDACIHAGIREPVDLVLDWEPVNVDLVCEIRRRAGGRPVIAVALPRCPMDRTDGYGDELLPDCRVIQRAIDRLSREAFIVQVGKHRPLFEFSGLHWDLANQTSVCELVDVAYAADVLLGYVSFFVPLAESFAKPAMFVWSSKGFASKNEWVRLVTPQKIIHRKALAHVVIDDCSGDELSRACDALLEQIGSPVLV